MTRNNLHLPFGPALPLLLLAASVASAAVDVTSSLTGFTGDSTQSGTQTAVSNAGFNFFEFGDSGTKVNFDTSGAHFGDGQGDALGRNYMRTIGADYANVSFQAEISIVTPNIDIQDAYVGLGAGNANTDFYRVPDYLLPNSSVLYWGENEVATPNIDIDVYRNGSSKSFFIDPATGLGNGTHRMRLDYDWFQKKATFSFDLNYAGGPFAADYSIAVSTLDLYGADGWPTEPARFYFGGDEGTVFKDFSVDVTTASMLMGDFNSSGTVTSADWAILRANQHTDLSGKTFSQAYFLGDLNADKANNHADFVLFKTLYEDANGAGSFAGLLAGVPEPSTFALFLSAGLMAFACRRGVNRA